MHIEKYFQHEEVDGEYKSKIESFQQGEFVTEPTLETDDVGKRVTDFTHKKFMWWACNKLFKRKFLTDNKITFPDMTTFEDFVFVYQCVVAAKNYVRVPFVSYHYRIRQNSLSRKMRNVTEVILNMAKAISMMDKFMLKHKFFIDNPKFRWDAIDFFAKWRINANVKYFISDNNTNIPNVFNIVYRTIFSQRPEDNAALTSWMFVMMNIYKLYVDNQKIQIADLKKKLTELGGNV